MAVPILRALLIDRAPTLEPSPPQETPGYVYVLGARTARGAKTYVGWTIDPQRRLAQHNAGTGAKSTRGLAWVALYLERHATRRAAMSREWHLKRDRRFRAALALGLGDG